MITDILKNLQTVLATIPELKYIDQNWGQLDDYSPNPPTQFPLVLIDVGTMQYNDIGRDRYSNPQNRQMGNGTIVLNIANLKLTNTSFMAPQQHKNDAWNIFNIIELVHEKLHGICPQGASSSLLRTNMRKIKRDDGIQEFEITYTIALTNV